MPLFSVITPTLNRPSLAACISSVASQTFQDYEHLLQFDGPYSPVPEPEKFRFPPEICCGLRHNNFGNTCRHLAWLRAIGNWVLYLDDDCTLADKNVLSDLAAALESIEEPWTLFPISRHGFYFLNDPPGLCQTDTANVVARREVARWPDVPNYEADGIWVEQLKAKYPYRAFPDFRPIVVMEKSNHGK